MTAEVNHLSPARPRYLYPAFIASLALNLLFIGLFAAAAWHHHEESSKPFEPGLMGFVRSFRKAVRPQSVTRSQVRGKG